MLSKSSSNPEPQIFTLQEQTNLFIFGKNVLIIMVPVLINKDVFEPSYNDLKFMVRNHNYFFTNLYKMTGEKLLHSTGRSARCSVITKKGGTI